MRALLANALVLGLLGCLEAPPSFERVDAEAARELLAGGRAALVAVLGADETAPDGGGLAWRVDPGAPVRLEAAPAGLPEGGLLLVADDAEIALRLAAALARPRNREVWVFIAGSAEERQSLYAVRSPEEEIPRGADS